MAAAIVIAARTRDEATDLARVDRLLAAGLERFGEMMRGDVVCAGRMLQHLLVERMRFTPINIPNVQRTYRLESTLSLGGMLGLNGRSKGNVSEGFCTLLFPRFQLLTIVKCAA